MRIGQAERIELPEVTCITPTESNLGEEVAITDHQEITEDLQVSLWEAVEKCGHLWDGEREQLYGLLLSYSDIFAHDKTDFC